MLPDCYSSSTPVSTSSANRVASNHRLWRLPRCRQQLVTLTSPFFPSPDRRFTLHHHRFTAPPCFIDLTSPLPLCLNVISYCLADLPFEDDQAVALFVELRGCALLVAQLPPATAVAVDRPRSSPPSFVSTMWEPCQAPLVVLLFPH